MRMVKTLTSAAIVAVLAFAAQAQIDPTRESTPATPLSTTLGLVVSPAKGQTRDQQGVDETECYSVTKAQTAVDPFAAPTPTAEQRATFVKEFRACLEARSYIVK